MVGCGGRCVGLVYWRVISFFGTVTCGGLKELCTCGAQE